MGEWGRAGKNCGRPAFATVPACLLCFGVPILTLIDQIWKPNRPHIGPVERAQKKEQPHWSSMASRTTNRDSSSTNRTTNFLVELIGSVPLIGHYDRLGRLIGRLENIDEY